VMVCFGELFKVFRINPALINVQRRIVFISYIILYRN
jgi:hypothetical protein